MIYFINDDVNSTREALITGILPLINNEYIKKRYIDEILKQFTQNLNQYILNENVLIFHLKSGFELSLKNGISLTYFTKPIIFKQHLNIQFIVSIAAIDEINHQKILEKARLLFENDQIIKKLSIQDTLKKFIAELENHDC